MFDAPRPYTSLCVIAVDRHGRIPVLYRGGNVRSAKNCWSLPTGLHEVGLTAEEQAQVELTEELGISCLAKHMRQVGMYENISVEDSWHWVIQVFVVPTLSNLDTLENKEPEKHDEVGTAGGLEHLLALELAPSMNDAFAKWGTLPGSPLAQAVADCQTIAERAHLACKHRKAS